MKKYGFRENLPVSIVMPSRLRVNYYRESSMSVVKTFALSLAFTISTSTAALAGQCDNRSGFSRAELIELYTSEGCSSCPPADKWMSALVPGVVAAEEVVPLAFHVDYWDRLGWRDRFASPAYTARQYANAKTGGSAYVFTPQVLVAGRNYQAWSNTSKLQNEVHRTRSTSPDASIALRQQPVAAGKLAFEVQVQLRQDANFSEVNIYAALFQNGLVSEVARGENSGSQLHHDYVVRSLLTSNPIDQSGKMKFSERFTLPDDAQLTAMGVAVFVQDTKTGTVLQAMSAPLCVNK